MKEYGWFKATEFTKKQINVIYYKAKNGELKVEKWLMNELYILADYYNYDFNGTVAEDERTVKKILDAVFANDIKTAQTLIDNYANDYFDRMSFKNQKKCDRTLFVA